MIMIVRIITIKGKIMIIIIMIKRRTKTIGPYQVYPCPFANSCMISSEQDETLAANYDPTLTFSRRIIAV